jgi:cyclic patellamide precursor peptide PatG
MGDGNRPARVFAQAEAVAPVQAACGCGAPEGSCTCSTGILPARLVYVLGTVDCRFPDQSVSDEFQAAAHTLGMEQGDQSVRSWVHQVLTHEPARKGLRYIARNISWLLAVEKQTAYYLALRDWQDLDDLIACLGEPDEHDLVLVAGSSSLRPVEASPGITAPILQVEQLCAYKWEELVSWCEVPSATTARRPQASRRRGSQTGAPSQPTPQSIFNSLFRRMVQTADNFGDTDERRALNFLAVRYKPLYQLYAQKIASGAYLLDSVKVMPSRLWRDRRIVDPVFTFVRGDTGSFEKYFVRVDVTYFFPFLINSFQPDEQGSYVPNYFDR